MWVTTQAALNRGLLPDDNTLTQLAQEQDSPVFGHSVDSLRWPDPELRVVLIRECCCLCLVPCQNNMHFSVCMHVASCAICTLRHLM